MGGHIYTEYASSDGTFISRDGVELFHFPQRERLKGLLIKDGDIYTLGLDLDGSGFTYRRNGEVLLRQDSGSVFGDFANTSYDRSGALYVDSGAVCFCFKNSVACYSVRNGVMTEGKTTSVASRVIDMRLLESSVYYIANYKGIMIAFSPTGSRTINAETVLQTANLFMHDGEVWFCADAADYTICRSVREAGLLSSGIIFRGGGNFIYDAGKQLYAANFRDGILSIRDDAGEYIYIRDSAFFFGPGNISCVGEDVFALVNSRERKVLPALWHGGSTFEYRLNGYLTDMEVEINPPR